MNSKITSNVRVSVTPEYDARASRPSENRFVFRYTIRIENLGPEPVRLLKRLWLIDDVGYGISQINGDGVIGMHPEIAHGETFSYFSNVILRSGIGKMAGKYLFEVSESKETFDVAIPEFFLFSKVLAN